MAVFISGITNIINSSAQQAVLVGTLFTQQQQPLKGKTEEEMVKDGIPQEMIDEWKRLNGEVQL